MTIVINHGITRKMEICHDIEIPRKRNLYKKDADGYYYIPEVQRKENMPWFKINSYVSKARGVA